MPIDLPDIGQNLSDSWAQHAILRAMTAAFAVGLIGSSAYLAALLFGFLGNQAIDQLGSKFETVKGNPATKRLSVRRLALFSFFGGGIALVFQWAQGGVFAPIQALVLGATWPTIISQWLSRGAEEQNKQNINQLADDFQSKPTG
jgi:MFS family permease